MTHQLHLPTAILDWYQRTHPHEPFTSAELFAGFGGLEMAVEDVFGAEPIWFSEFDQAPSKILAHHWPDVPNLGDVTLLDWAELERPTVLGGGFPCQDVSLAGRRAGMTSETRSGLWFHFLKGIQTMQPPFVVAENVRGILSAKAKRDALDVAPEVAEIDSKIDDLTDAKATLEENSTSADDLERYNELEEAISGLMEQRTILLGDEPDGPANRALGVVLGDLADAGYDAWWCGLRAADVGAPHGRFRVFILGIRRDILTQFLQDTADPNG